MHIWVDADACPLAIKEMAPLDNVDRKRFADPLDRLLTRLKNLQTPA